MARRKVAIVTDSTAFLPQEYIEKYDIHAIPLNLHWGDETLRDTEDISPAEFYVRLQQSDRLPTTSQPSAGRFLTFFQEVAESADSIVAILLSQKLSGTVASAHAAVEMMESDYPIEIVDSLSASLGLGLIVLAAARAAEEGQDFQQVARVARTLSPHVRVVFVVDTLEYLHKGGRIGGAKRLLGSVLSIKPLLQLRDGEIEALASVRTKRKAVERMIEIVQEETTGATELHMGVIDAAAAKEGDELLQQVKQVFSPVELLRSELSPVIGTHTGPGTVGVGYYDGAVLAQLDQE
jgi:DegV family protein with EDD domain